MQILIVDDSPSETRVIAAAIRGLADVEAIRFMSAEHALDWAAASESIVAVVDFHMPQMDGLVFMQRLRALPGKLETPVILVTADADLGVRLRALEMGVNDFVIKPYRAADIRARIFAVHDAYRLSLARTRQAALAQTNEAFASS